MMRLGSRRRSLRTSPAWCCNASLQCPKHTGGSNLNPSETALKMLTIEGKPKPMIQANRTAKFAIRHVVKHRRDPFRGVIFDVDPTYANTEEWLMSIPEGDRPQRDQPFYQLLAENSQSEYIAYVSEQNLLIDDSHDPVRHS